MFTWMWCQRMMSVWCAQWFTKAGFADVRIKRIGPTWYRGVRRHGLIMGCSVTGVKPKALASPPYSQHASFRRLWSMLAWNFHAHKSPKAFLFLDGKATQAVEHCLHVQTHCMQIG